MFLLTLGYLKPSSPENIPLAFFGGISLCISAVFFSRKNFVDLESKSFVRTYLLLPVLKKSFPFSNYSSLIRRPICIGDTGFEHYIRVIATPVMSDSDALVLSTFRFCGADPNTHAESIAFVHELSRMTGIPTNPEIREDV